MRRPRFSRLAGGLLLALLGTLSGCSDDDNDGGSSGSSGGAGQGGKGGATQGGQGGAGASAGASGQAGADGGSGQAGAGGAAGQAGSGGAAGQGGSGGAAGQAGAGGSAGASGQGGSPSSPVDTTFGQDGFFDFKGVPALSRMFSVSLAPGDGIDLLALTAEGYIVVVRVLADGKLDTSFDGDGVWYLDVPAFSAFHSVTQPDGKVVIGGVDGEEYYTRAAFLRLNADGSHDESFGVGGYSALDSEGGRAFKITLQDDHVFAVGSGGFSEPGVPGGLDAMALRTQPGGALDPSFHAPSGYDYYASPGGSYSYMYGAHAAPGGLLYSCGNVAAFDEPGNDYDFLVLRYLSDGSLDPSFQGGALQIKHHGQSGPFPFVHNQCRQLVEAPDGKVVFGGHTEDLEIGFFSNLMVVRTLHDGTLDPTFANGGVYELDLDDTDGLTDVVALPDGSLVVGGYTGGYDAFEPTVLRLRADGTLDPSFGAGGVFRFRQPEPLPFASTQSAPDGAFFATQADGKIVVGGAISTPFLMRLQAP